MSEPIPDPTPTAVKSITLARFYGMIRPLGGKVAYLATVLLLLGLLRFGHATHWTFQSWGTAPADPLPALVAATFRADADELEIHPLEPDAAGPADAAEDYPTIALGSREIRKAGIELHLVGRRPIEHSLTAHGVVAYNQNLVAQLSSRVPGNVWRVEKQVGQRIQKGDVLAIVDAIEVGRAKADLLQAIVQAELKQKALERLKAAGMALPEKLLHEMVIEERLARIRMQNAVQTLINFGLPLALEDLQSLNDEQRARKIQFLGLPESLVATLDPRTTTANLLPLFAPFDGVVIGREITVGETVSPDQSHFVIADIRRMWVIMDVRKEDANLVRIGQAITFVADELPTRIAGHIDWISTEVDASTRTLQVRAEVDNPVLDSAAGNHSEQRLLRARTYGTARIVVRSNPQAVVVPNSSVQREGDSFFVFSRRGNQFRRIGVQPGVVAGGWTEIREGIDAGVVVAAVGSHVVKAEMQLTRNDG